MGSVLDKIKHTYENSSKSFEDDLNYCLEFFMFYDSESSFLPIDEENKQIGNSFYESLEVICKELNHTSRRKINIKLVE